MLLSVRLQPNLQIMGLGWKGLPGTNALAYYEKSFLTTAKSFITLALGGQSFNLYLNVVHFINTSVN